MKALETFAISKRFEGGKLALDQVSLEVHAGDAVALVGPNGAGKTTLLRILSTLLKPTSGFAQVFGLDGRFHASKIRRCIGYMPDKFGVYEDLTVEEYLEFFGRVYRMGGAELAKRVRDLISMLDLESYRSTFTNHLSRGIQQRVGLARILIHDPDLLLLDEPASGLDPRARIEIFQLLKQLHEMGKTLLLSSHILRELDLVCGRLVLIDEGKVRFSGPIQEAAQKIRPRRHVLLKTDPMPGNAMGVLEGNPQIERIKQENGYLRLVLQKEVSDYSSIISPLVKEGIRIVELREEECSLEEIFLHLTEKTEP